MIKAKKEETLAKYFKSRRFQDMRCSDCWGEFPLTAHYWHRHKNRPNGFSHICKKCKSERDKAKFKANYKKKRLTEYALYKKDDLLAVGTIKEIAKQMKITELTLRKYSTPSFLNRGRGAENRRRLIRLEDDDDGEQVL